MNEEIREENFIEQIKKNSIKSVLSLTIRRIILRIIAQLAFIILARILTPQEFGIFTIVSFIVNFFGFFSDIGLAAALIQKKGEITTQDLRTTFTVQQMIVGTLVVIIILCAPYIVTTLYKETLQNEHTLLVQILACSLLLASLKSIPSVVLERKVQFEKLIIPEIIETLIYNGIAITMAYAGYGIWSLIIAVLLRGIIGVIVIHILQPWPIGIAFNKNAFKQLYAFGLPYQLNGLIALIKDNIVPTYVATTLGTTAVGYSMWAQKYALLPLEPMNDIIRVTFPTYARLQEHPEILKKALEKTLYITTLCVYPLLAGLVALAPWIVSIIFTEKWSAALPLLYLFTINTFWAVLSTTCTNALFAIGKSKIVLNFMILWTILTWTLTPLCTMIYGLLGIAIASALIACTSVGILYITKKYIKVDFVKTIKKQVIIATIMGVAVRILGNIMIVNLVTLLLVIALGAAIYAYGMYMVDKKKLYTEITSVIKIYKNKK